MPAELLAGTAPPTRPYDADIVILSHHRLAETIAAIRSAAGQTGCDHHVIVLDQNSPAPMREALSATIAALPNVALYGIDRNLGVPGGRNHATALGAGRAIIALDNDAVFTTTDVVARAASRLAASRLAAIGFRILAADASTLDLTSWGYPKSRIGAAAQTFATTTFVGCGHALSRACLDAIGPYDDTLFFTWEEYEWSRRAIAAGWRIEYHGDLSVTHAVSGEARIGWNGTRWRYFVRNRLLIAHDWHGTAGMIPHALFYFARGLGTLRMVETLGAITEAYRIAPNRARHPAGASNAYIHSHETIHRLPAVIRRLISADATAPAMPGPRAARPAPSGRS